MILKLLLKFRSPKILYSAAIAFTGFTAFAQSPGGVSSNLTLWLKADNAATITGSPVQSWLTSGGSATGYKLTQSTAANRPALVNGATNYTKFNYNPTIKFTATSSNKLYTTAASPDLMGNNGTAIIVITQEVPNGSSFTYYSGTTGRYPFKPNLRFQTGNTGTGYTFDWTAPTEYPITAASIITSYGCATNAALRKNSVQFTTPNNTAVLYNPSVVTGLYLGANNSSEYTNSSVAEVILFNVKPSAAEMDRIETYLAIKYGITRGGNTNTTSTYNYIASDGTTIIWDKTANTGFNNDIAGIGRDDNSGLNQKQSISVNNGEAVTIAIANGAIPTENSTNTTTFSNNNMTFLTWGNNGLAKTFNAAANKPAGIVERLNRIWKTQSSKFNQQVTVGFEASQITGLGNIGTLCLVFDDDGTDLSNATVVAACSATNPSGSRIEFTGVNIPSGKPYFTLARVKTPTAISSNTPCEGSALNLVSETLASNTTYSWTGPNGFTSADQNPTITSATTAATGPYSVTINNYGCTTVLNTTATVNPNINPTFAAVAPICSGDPMSPLPTTSNEGLTGTWSPALDNTKTTTYTFTPNPGQCGYTTTLSIVVNPHKIPTFAGVDPICSGDPLSPLPTSSNENVTGNWSPALDNTQTITYTFTPDSGQCADNSNLTIKVIPITVPTFTAVSPICFGDSIADLPTTSNEGVAGTWAPPIDSTQTTTYTFTPNNTMCTPNAAMSIQVNPIPNPQPKDGIVCFNAETKTVVNPYTIDTGLSESEYQFTWYLQPDTSPITGETASTYVAKEAGDYTVEVVDSTTGCHATKNIHVAQANSAQSATAIVTNYFEDDQVITINVIGDGSYLYELDNNGVFQESNQFHYAASGEHTVTIHDTMGCTEIVLEHILIIGYPHFFTPNSDGSNDTWNISSLQDQPDSEIFIFDRYGKLIKQTNPIAEGWDGTYNGHPLPSSDYWFTVKFRENNIEKVFKAHFSLKR